MGSPKASDMMAAWTPGKKWLLLSFCVFFIPFYWLCHIATHNFYLSDINATLLDKIYIILATGRLESAGFLYPPLPFLLVLPLHSLSWLGVCSAVVAAILGTIMARNMIQTDIDHRLLVVLMASVFFSPLFLHQVAANLPNILGIIFLVLAVLHYREYLAGEKISYAFLSGILLAGALLATPSAILLLAIFVVLNHLLQPSRSISEVLSINAVLAFPSVAIILTWTYLSWLFTGSLAFGYRLWFPQFGLSWLWMIPIYWAVALLLIDAPKRLAIHVAPLALLPFFPTLGFIDIGGAVIFLTIYALLNIPRQRLGRRGQWILLAGLVLQLAGGLYQMRHPLIPPADEQTRTEFAVSQALAKAPPASILTDDRQTYRIIAMAGTARPFLTPANSRYANAELQPTHFALYWLRGSDLHSQSIPDTEADGMILEARFGQYRLYRRRNAPPLIPEPR